MKLFSHIFILSFCCLVGSSALSVQLEEIQLPPPVVAAPGGTGTTILLDLLDMEAWGATEVAKHSDKPNSMTMPGGHMLSSHPFEVEPIRFTDMLFARGASKARLLIFSVLCVLFVMALILAPWKCWWNSSDHDLSDMSADTPDLAAVAEISNGSWAEAYKNSNAEHKKGFELLFRCKIVSVQEFAHSRASQEHIDECVWIAIEMLKQRPLEEWVAWRPQALQTFEDSITAVFAARAQYEGDTLSLKDTLWTNRIRGEDNEAALTPPVTPPLQGALKDILLLKGGFPSPLVRSRCNTGNSNASTVQASPATPGRFPAHFAEYHRSVTPPFSADNNVMDVTFDPASQDVFKTVPHAIAAPQQMPEPQGWQPQHGAPQRFRPAAKFRS